MYSVRKKKNENYYNVFKDSKILYSFNTKASAINKVKELEAPNLNNDFIIFMEGIYKESKKLIESNKDKLEKMLLDDISFPNQYESKLYGLILLDELIQFYKKNEITDEAKAVFMKSLPKVHLQKIQDLLAPAPAPASKKESKPKKVSKKKAKKEENEIGRNWYTDPSLQKKRNELLKLVEKPVNMDTLEEDKINFINKVRTYFTEEEQQRGRNSYYGFIVKQENIKLTDEIIKYEDIFKTLVSTYMIRIIYSSGAHEIAFSSSFTETLYNYLIDIRNKLKELKTMPESKPQYSVRKKRNDSYYSVYKNDKILYSYKLKDDALKKIKELEQ